MSNRDGRLTPARQTSMSIQVLAVTESGHTDFELTTHVDAVALMLAAEEREALARSKGREFTEGALPFYGSELITAARSGAGAAEVERAAMNVALSACLVDLIYGGVSPEAFMKSNLRFTLLPSGAVRYDRLLG